VNKPYCIQERKYISEDSFMLKFYEKSGWTDWRISERFKTEKQRDESFNNLIKKQLNYRNIMAKIYANYEYRKLDI
jgi:hypothetical protein